MSHVVAFFLSLVGGPPLPVLAPTLEARLAVGVYAATLGGLFGASALLPRRSWSQPWHRWMRRLDHAMIVLTIGGTYTAIAGLSLAGELAGTLLWLVWVGALAGALLRVAWVDIPEWLSAVPYLALGWVALVALPQLQERLGEIGFGLLLTGGALHTIGALVFARRRPNPSPAVFGYREDFHLFVVMAAIAHYATLAGFVLPRLQR